MAHKTAWHTDIVVSGQGMNLKLLEHETSGKFKLAIMPDVSGQASLKALRKFREAVRENRKDVSSMSEAKAHVARAVKKVRARWNGWHREAY